MASRMLTFVVSMVYEPFYILPLCNGCHSRQLNPQPHIQQDNAIATQSPWHVSYNKHTACAHKNYQAPEISATHNKAVHELAFYMVMPFRTKRGEQQRGKVKKNTDSKICLYFILTLSIWDRNNKASGAASVPGCQVSCDQSWTVRTIVSRHYKYKNNNRGINECLICLLYTTR